MSNIGNVTLDIHTFSKPFMKYVLDTRASKDSIYFETRVRVFSGPTITSPSPDSSLNSYTHNYLF